jgi:endonuclease-3 related protein
LLSAHGPQAWWPADGPFEVMVGAVLTQNTAWVNVERAIENLKRAQALSATAIVGLPEPRLAELLRPSGYFNVKARRLRAFCAWYLAAGGLERLGRLQTARLRRALLAVPGVGPETADDILLYAFGRPVFVVDAYTRRLFGRLGLVDPDLPYDDVRRAFEAALGRRPALYNEYHALIVRHAKDVCRPRPLCAACCLSGRCPAGQRDLETAAGASSSC